MTTPNATGAEFEERCCELLSTYGISYEKHRRIMNGNTWYTPDALTKSYVIESKYQQVGGSVVKKLTQALFELDWLANKLAKIPILVYEGEHLTSFVENDPAFLKAHSYLSHINVLDFKTFDELISKSTDFNNRKQNRLLEYA